GVAAGQVVPERMQVPALADDDEISSRIAIRLGFQEAADAMQRLMQIARYMFDPRQIISARVRDHSGQLAQRVRRRLFVRLGAIRSVRSIEVVPVGVALHIGKAWNKRSGNGVGASVVPEPRIAFDGVGPDGGCEKYRSGISGQDGSVVGVLFEKCV